MAPLSHPWRPTPSPFSSPLGALLWHTQIPPLFVQLAIPSSRNVSLCTCPVPWRTTSPWAGTRRRLPKCSHDCAFPYLARDKPLPAPFFLSLLSAAGNQGTDPCSLLLLLSASSLQ
jgi:hypothetical protein